MGFSLGSEYQSKGGVPFRHPPERNPRLAAPLPRCRLQIHFGADDYIVKAPDIEALAARLRDAGAQVQVYEYAGAGHAFLDRTDTSAYRAQAAGTARMRYLKFLRKSLA
jgi:dienelactone hydrolase